MASVKSLGLHQPSGLAHAIEEQLLPKNPPSTSYHWDIFSEDKENEDIEDELLTTDSCVIWCRGGIFRKTYKFDLEKEPITQALLAYFPASEDDGAKDSGNDARPRKELALSKALVVFLKTQAHIYFLSGTSHVVHMPFEVESAVAGPVGVIIQRRLRSDATPMSLKFPQVPPNSFVSSQVTAFNSSQQTVFSVEGLGIPKELSLYKGSTLDKLWDAPLDQPGSRWPRLVSLKDPLLELGLVVMDTDLHNNKASRKSMASKRSFLDPAEEVLHIEQIKVPGTQIQDVGDPLIIAVTNNREANTYTIWRLTYLKREDHFLGRSKEAKRNARRRRSSMAPGFLSGTSTPVPPNLRESFGAPLPGKRPKKVEKVEKPIDLVSSLEQQDKEGNGAIRRSSRRVSSMLARADLSASHERPVFSEQPLLSGHAGSKRHDSQSIHHPRISANYNQQIHPSLGSLLEAPFDMGLDEGFHNMGLDDHGYDGLQHDVVFTRVRTLSSENTNVRFFATDQPPARNETKVFVLSAPPFAVDGHNSSQVLVGLQDLAEKRLQLITLHLKVQYEYDLAAKTGQGNHPTGATISLTSGEGDLRRAQNVVDSCKLVDGDNSVILILSESQHGRHELSTQAPWGALTMLSLPVLNVDSIRSLQFRGRDKDRDVKQRKSEVIDPANGSIVGVRYPRSGGVVDVLDTEGRLHQLCIQLQPRTPKVRKVLDALRGLLPQARGERVTAGWLLCMQWISRQQEPVADIEWSAAVTILLAMFLNLGRTDMDSIPSTNTNTRRNRPASGSFGSIKDSEAWRTMINRESNHSLSCPIWMMNKGWEWALDEVADDFGSLQGGEGSNLSFISRHVTLAKTYLTSGPGDDAFGARGYMPTSLARPQDAARKDARDIFMGLHLLLEEEKLDIMTPEYASPGRSDLGAVLGQISRWLRWHDFSTIYDLPINDGIDQQKLAFMLQPSIPQPLVRPDILVWIQARLVEGRREHYPTPADIFYASSRLSEEEKSRDRRWEAVLPRTFLFKRLFRVLRSKSTAVQLVEAMYDAGFTNTILQTLPEAVLVPLYDAISLCQPDPPSDWSPELLKTVHRSDISQFVFKGQRSQPTASKILTPTHMATWDFRMLTQSIEESNSMGYDEVEGTERHSVIRGLFKDRRLNEAQDLLATFKTRVLRLDTRPGWSESEYLEKQKDHVARIAVGTLAIPAGKGLLYYSLRHPLITQKLPISGFNLNCIVKPTNVTVGVDKTLFTEDKVSWAFFHQGAASGLAISPQAKGIDSSWILYNKPGQDLNNRHAGFLLALGLNGHLKNVVKWVTFKYLTPKHTMTSIGFLLGLAASYMGTMDAPITRLLSVHAKCMLPRGSAELNLAPITQTSAIMGIGLLYANRQHRRMSEIMLSEIEHVEDDDEEEPLRSECYRLAAGYALGFINLGKGTDLKGLHDMKLTEKLITYATATKNIEMVHILDRAAAGAVMAIAFIFMKSEDQVVARKINVPDSVLQFDYVRPDILLLRTVAKNLIMWSKIDPTFSWIQKSLPRPYRSRHMLEEIRKLRSTDLPFFSILAGICFSIGLRFSGSASHKVRDLLLYYLDQFMRIANIPGTPPVGPNTAPAYDKELARSYARMCQDTVALSVSIVMSGTADVAVHRRLRALHGREDPDVPYGSHLAAHLAIGALFLGCGTVSFGTSDKAIAALLIAFYPILPANVMDNRSHLQAFRHFWVLATEQRCMVTKDVLTGQLMSVPVEIRMRKDSATETIFGRTTPCLLPPLDQIESVKIACGPRYWDMTLNVDDKLREALAKHESVYLQRRPPREGAFPSTLRALGSDEIGKNPIEWVFSLDALRGISHGERAVVLERGDDAQQVSNAVDARLEMERGIAEGIDRERLEGARLLFEWGAQRERLIHASVDVSQETVKDVRQLEETGSAIAQEEEAWWMRDSVIESLKGQVWMAGRDGE